MTNELLQPTFTNPNAAERPASASSARPATLLDLDLTELRAWFTERGEPGYRADQVWKAVYGELAPDASAITTLPKTLRTRLAQELPPPVLEPIREWVADGGDTHKSLFRLHDGREIETVMMQYEDGRATVCVSSQAGCALGCVFCATGLGGFDRNLSSGEILGQILFYARVLKERGKRLTNIVYMGMGEPLANPAAVWKSIHALHRPDGMNFSPRRITVSTVGLVPRIRDFARSGLPVNLAISLHAPDDELRASMMPINNRWPLAELIAAAREYTVMTGRRISFEYALIAGRNSSPEQAAALAELLSGLLCHVNLIPLNRVLGSDLEPPSHSQVLEFQRVLVEAGVPCTVRLERGADILAACGQLRADHGSSQ